MISENDMNIIEDNEMKEDKKEESSTVMDTNKEEETIVASSEEPSTTKEEEQTNIDQVEKSDILTKSETEIEDEAMDTQALFEQPIILEGKRSRKPTLRLEVSELVPMKKELSIPKGHGKPLGEIEYINYQITRASTDVLSRMRNICFGRRGNKSNIRKHLREFQGFEFERNSDEYEKHLSNLIKFKKDQLRSISNILGLPSTGRNIDHAERILKFLIEPIDEGKRIPGKKSAKRRTNSSKSTDTDQENKKQKLENGNDKHELDNVSKPGKKRQSNHDTSPDAKRKKSTKETIKVNGNSNLTEEIQSKI